MRKEKNPFELFGIPISFKVDINMVDKKFITTQKAYHPDSKNGDVDKSLKITQSYHILKDEIKRGEEIIKIFNINKDTVILPPNFFSMIFRMTEYMQEASRQESERILESERSTLNQVGDSIDHQNIKDFIEAFIKFKYIKKAFTNIYGA